MQDVAFEVAEGLGDKSTLAECHLYRGMSFKDHSQYEAAVSSYQKALTLFRDANDRQGEGRTLHNMGNVLKEKGLYTEAMQNYQDSLKIGTDLGDRAGQASDLVGIASVYQATGRYAEALEQYQDSLKFTRELGYRAVEARTLNIIGVVCKHMGRYAEATQHYQECLKIRRDLGDRKGEAQTLNNLGIVYKDTGRYAEALEQHQDSLDIARELGDHALEAEALNHIGVVYKDTSRYTEALQQYQDSLKITRELKDRPAEASTLNNVGLVYEATGRYVAALQHFQASLNIARDVGDRSGERNALGNIGMVYEHTGRYADAMQKYQDSLKITRELKDRDNEARTFNSIGNVYEATGRYADALQNYQDGLKITRELKDRAGEASTLNNSGTLYDYTGRYAEALQQYQASLKITRELGNRALEATTLLNIGNVYWDTGRYAKALQQYQDSLKITRDLCDRAGERKALDHIGDVCWITGRYEEALQQYQDSLKITHELGDRAGEVKALIGIGAVYDTMGRLAEALQQFQDCLKVARDVGDRRAEETALADIGYVCQKQKHWPEAVQALREAVSVMELLRADTREPSLQTSLLAQKTDPFFQLAVCLLEIQNPSEAFASAEHMKARGLVDILQQGKADPRRGMSDDERKQEQALQDRVTALGVQVEDPKGKADGPKRKSLIDGLDAPARISKPSTATSTCTGRTCRRRAPSSRRRPWTTWVDRCSPAVPGLVVLSHLVGKDETLLFVLTAGDREGAPARLTVHRIDVGRKDLAEAVEAFRDACSDPAKGEPDSDDLYRWLIAPAAKELTTAKQVIVVPDGVLHTLPFQALKDPDGKYLLERFAVSYAPSATALLKMEELGAKRRKQYAGQAPSLLAVGVSEFGHREKPLPAAEQEARAVAEAFGAGARLLPGAEATHAKLEAAWGSCRYLHFATHGRLNPDAPLYSSLVLSPDHDEGVLYARDLLDADVPAELVVMSACHTGEGQHVAGEGLQGMSWAWFVAGVPSAVASQWSVGDASTARLMKVFYARLMAGDSKAEALRQAELALLKDPGTRHPFYWAPFVLVGDDR